MWRAMSTSPCSPSPSNSPWWVQRKKKGEKRARGVAARPAASRAPSAASRQDQPPGTPRRRSMLLPPAPLGHPGHGGTAAPLRSSPLPAGRDGTRRDGTGRGVGRTGRDGAGGAPPRSPRKFGERGAARRGAERSEVRATAALPRSQKAALPRAAPPSPSTAAGVRGSEPGARGLGIIYFPRCRGGREGKVPPPPPPLSPPPPAPPAPPAPRSARPGAVLPLRGGGLPARRCRCPLSAAGPCLRVPAPAPAPGAAPWSLALLLQPALP